jgi:hypothetical protein
MGISNFADLRQWFFAGVKGKGEGQLEAAPHWNLYAGDYGAREQRIMFNNRIGDMDESFAFLETSIRAQNTPDGTRFRVQTYAPGKPNNPTAETYVQIYEKSQAPASAPTGIAGLPAGVGSIQQYMDERLETERLKWKIQQLEDQINAPNEKWERVVEYISGVPGIDKVLQTVALGLVSKFNPSAMPAIQAAMNGTPEQQSQQTGEHEPDANNDPDAVFFAAVHETSATLGTDPVTMMQKLNALVKNNPDLARQLLQQQ